MPSSTSALRTGRASRACERAFRQPIGGGTPACLKSSPFPTHNGPTISRHHKAYSLIYMLPLSAKSSAQLRTRLLLRKMAPLTHHLARTGSRWPLECSDKSTFWACLFSVNYKFRGWLRSYDFGLLQRGDLVRIEAELFKDFVLLLAEFRRPRHHAARRA